MFSKFLKDSRPKAPRVSQAIGTKTLDLVRWPYIFFFCSSASAATKLAPLVAYEVYKEARVSLQVASQTNCLPSFQGTRYGHTIWFFFHQICKFLMVQGVQAGQHSEYLNHQISWAWVLVGSPLAVWTLLIYQNHITEWRENKGKYAEDTETWECTGVPK